VKRLEQAVHNEVRQALIDNDGDVINTSKDLGCHRRTLYEYVLRWPEFEDYVVPRKLGGKLGNKNGNEKWERYPDE
jgi:hypothetical protein